MKHPVCVLLVMLILSGLCARAADDAPSVTTVQSELKRVVVVRMKYNDDLLKGLEQAVKREKIKNAVILSGAGSVTGYHVHAVANTTLPAKLAYTEQKNTPMDLIAANGYVLNGRIHAHITMTDDKRAFGGHLHEGTPVFTVAIITLGILDDNVDLSKFDDSNWR